MVALGLPAIHQRAELSLQMTSVITGSGKIKDIEKLRIRHLFELVLAEGKVLVPGYLLQQALPRGRPIGVLIAVYSVADEQRR